MDIIGIIPARYASSRFPGKPLIDILGKSMIQRVYEQAIKTRLLKNVYVATDDDRIYNHVKTYTNQVILTGSHHINGTERCQEVVELLHENCDAVINIQGDEPYIMPEQIDQLANIFIQDKSVEIATLVKPSQDISLMQNEGVVKVVLNKKKEALYFSRSMIPFYRNKELDPTYFKHIGIYGYRKDVLQKIVQLAPGKLEQIESLEQLRWLENGFVIQCDYTQYETKSIDTPEDLEYLIQQKKALL